MCRQKPSNGRRHSVRESGASSLSPMGNVVSIEYLGHLKKVKEHLLLWKVSYNLGEEEILWHLNLSDGDVPVRPVGLLFDL